MAGLLCLAFSSYGFSKNTKITIDNTGNISSKELGIVTNKQSIGQTLSGLLGTDKTTESNFYGTWRYHQPGVAFTSKNVLASVGGEIAAAEIRSKLKSSYDEAGVKNSNTYLTFNQDKTFTGKIDGKSLNGKWSYDSKNQKIMLQTLLFTIPFYTKKTSNGMSFLMESKKLLTFFQTVASLTGSSSLQAISDLSKNYNGVRMGFDMRK